MTKPTGRPRGRPKTKEYVTLMARVDLTLANQVKRYASLHRQPISFVIRDALSLLMEEYPAEANPTGSHRLAAHEFLSDRYESPLDTLVGETGTAELEEFVSDKNKAAMALLDADEQSAKEYVSDTQEDEDILSDANRDTDKAYDMNMDADNVSDVNREAESLSGTNTGEVLVSDIKAVSMDIVSDTNTPPFDESKYMLGAKLCNGKHEYGNTGKTLVTAIGHKCPQCQIEQQRQRRKAKRQAAHA